MGQLTESTLIAWFLREVYRYLHEPKIRREAQDLVLNALTPGETRVLIAHSLGSVVAYEALARDSKQVEVFITCGSPLGLPKLVFDQLQPGPSGGRLPWPGNVRRWINLAQPKDVVAMTKRLAPMVSRGSVGQAVEDFLVPDPSGLFRAHNADHYLDRPEISSALVALFPSLS
jgi:pimeloyl-ACP methyl ester carboxylesterase